MKFSLVDYESHTVRGDFDQLMVYVLRSIPRDLHKGGLKDILGCL